MVLKNLTRIGENKTKKIMGLRNGIQTKMVKSLRETNMIMKIMKIFGLLKGGNPTKKNQRKKKKPKKKVKNNGNK